MKKLAITLITLLILVACVDKSIVTKDGEFKISEAQFVEIYEEVNDKKFPSNIVVYPELFQIENGNHEETVQFLEAVDKALDQKKIKSFKEDFEKREDNLTFIEEEEYLLTYQVGMDDKYSVMVLALVKDSDD